MPVSDRLIDAFIEDFREKRERTCLHGGRECRFVQGTFPIPWFGDSAAYGKAGNRRIVTVGVNPSPLEFADGPDAPFALRELPETGAAGFLREQCDGYFGRHPSGWFDGMVPVLRAFDASYRAGHRTNVAIHVNAFSGLSTDPAWEVLKGKLGGDYGDLFGGFARPELFTCSCGSWSPTSWSSGKTRAGRCAVAWSMACARRARSGGRRRFAAARSGERTTNHALDTNKRESEHGKRNDENPHDRPGRRPHRGKGVSQPDGHRMR